MKPVATVILLRKDESALLQKRDNKPEILYPGLWGFPGGHLKGNEKIEECAQRELFEETNYRSTSLKLLTVLEDSPPNAPSYPLTAFWELYDEHQDIICHEGERLKFIHRSELPTHPTPDCTPILWDLALEAFKKEKGNL